MLVVHNNCTKRNIDVSSEQEAIDTANARVGKNQKIVYKDGKEFHVSEDGYWTWRKDFHKAPGRPAQNHINVERWKYPFGAKENKILENIHIWY